MSISMSEIKKAATALSENEKQARSIASAAGSFNLLHRDDTLIVKNGARNMCRLSFLSSSSFAPWLARRTGESGRIGVYVSKQSSSHSDVRDICAIAADTGYLPSDIGKIAVLPGRGSDKSLDIIKRARERLGLDVVVVRDETGNLDGESMLPSGFVRKVKIPASIGDGDHAMRYEGELTERSATSEKHYLQAAASACSRAATEMTYGKLWWFREMLLLSSPHISSMATAAISGRYEVTSLSLASYATDGQDRPQTFDFASENIPYEEHDCRVFSFASSDIFLETLSSQEKATESLSEICMLWEHIYGQHGRDDQRFDKLDKVIHSGKIDWRDDAKAKRVVDRISKLANDYGIASMVDTLRSGVPFEDIVA